jgi:hypothetical protein
MTQERDADRTAAARACRDPARTSSPTATARKVAAAIGAETPPPPKPETTTGR